MGKIICGIQQVGIGVDDVNEAWKWYHEHFGMDIRVFEEEAVADLMLPYTNGQAVRRHAALAMNMHGGGGFEIWQHKDKTPTAAEFDLKLGDTGIYAAKIKSSNLDEAFLKLKNEGVNLLGEISEDPVGTRHFYVSDPYGNIFEFVEEQHIYKKHNGHNGVNGGVYGAVIGVTDFEKAKALYCDILEYDEVVYDVEGSFDDINVLPGGDGVFRRVLLRHSAIRRGPFSKLLGPTQIELVTSRSHEPRSIFAHRIWGDLGFIHLCFDVQGMAQLKKECAEHGYPFTVDSANSFDMGVAAGHFAYIEDPDGTLIEFVETHKLPIIEKIGWYMNLKRRKPHKALPNWMVNTLAFGRVKKEEF